MSQRFEIADIRAPDCRLVKQLPLNSWSDDAIQCRSTDCDAKTVKDDLFVVNQRKLTLFCAKHRYQVKKSRYSLQNPVVIDS